MRNLKIVGVDVFLEKRKTRVHVGSLIREGKTLVFTYDDKYFLSKNIIPLGPEFPLTAKRFVSEKLFPSLQDRIPSEKNPAYKEYCMMMGVDANERDPFILLSTIGRRGPSSFVFSPIFENLLTGDDLLSFRKELGLTTREFAELFEFSQNSITAFEKGKRTGKEIAKRLEILRTFPEVALNYLLINGGCVMQQKWLAAVQKLRERSSLKLKT